MSATSIIQGRARMYPDPLKTAADWRERAEAKHLSIRDLIIEVTGRQSFIGTPTHVADQIDEFVQTDARRRLHPRPPHHAGRPRRLRRPGGPAAPGARLFRSEYEFADAPREHGPPPGRALRHGGVGAGRPG